MALLVVFAAGCRTSLDVDVVVAEDGSGTVSVLAVLDRDAAGAVLDLQREGLLLEDLFQTGWDISRPETNEQGSIEVSATKAFGTPAQFGEIMAELSGDDGLVGPFELTRTKAFARVDYAIEGELRPQGLEPFADDTLSAALGRSVTELAERYGASAADVDVTMAIRLPGSVDPDLSTGDPVVGQADSTRIWRTRLDAPSTTSVAIASSTRAVAALVWRGIAVVAAALAVLVAFGHVLRVVRPERRRGGRGRDDPPRPRARNPQPVMDVAEAPGDVDDADALPAVVAIDGMGVLYREGDDINQLLVPFVRAHGSETTHDQIVARARSMSLGRITPADFWRSVGLDADPNVLDEEYLAGFQLNPGVIRFLRHLRESGVQIACVTNDSAAWATKLRARHSLEGLIDPWIVSGAVGVRKPDKPIFEVLRRVTSTPPARILVVDDDLDILDAARSYGFRTAWFAPDAAADASRQHAILRSFRIEEPADRAP